MCVSPDVQIEQKRFAKILEAGGLAKAYPEMCKLEEDGQHDEEWTDEKMAVVTWCGHSPKFGQQGDAHRTLPCAAGIGGERGVRLYTWLSW